jgi:hypothetical protein
MIHVYLNRRLWLLKQRATKCTSALSPWQPSGALMGGEREWERRGDIVGKTGMETGAEQRSRLTLVIRELHTVRD